MTRTSAHEAALELLRAGLVSADWIVRSGSVNALVALDYDPGLHMALNSRDGSVRAAAVKALGGHPGDSVVWRLAPLAWDSVTAVRLAVAEALEGAARAYFRAHGASDPAVRRPAASGSCCRWQREAPSKVNRAWQR